VPFDEDFFAIYGEAAKVRKVRGRLRHDRPPVGLGSRPWPLRVSDFDVLDHVNNARSLEAMEDELDRQLPGYAPVRVSVEYRGTLQRGDTVELASEVRGAGDDTELTAWVLVDGEVRISAQIGVQAPDDGRRS
jgi:acyl-ACP thioesterase